MSSNNNDDFFTTPLTRKRFDSQYSIQENTDVMSSESFESVNPLVPTIDALPQINELNIEPAFDSSNQISQSSPPNQTISFEPKLPDFGPALLVPQNTNLKVITPRGQWETLESSIQTAKLNRTLRAGLSNRRNYTQPIDLIISLAGSEATKVNEKYGVEDGFPTGMLARQLKLAIRVQNSVGKIDNSFNEPTEERPLGVAIVSTLSDDDHALQTSKKNILASGGIEKALQAAQKGRLSKKGPLRPTFVDELGRPMMFSVGEGVTLGTLRTGKIGGGKSLTAYASSSPVDAIERQEENWAVLNNILGSSTQPVIIPPIMSIGGTSFDAYLAFYDQQRGRNPEGVLQFITTQPQDRLENHIAAAASRKKFESVAGLVCINSGDVINDIPVVMLDMADEATARSVDAEILRIALEQFNGLQPANSMDRSDVIVKMKEYSGVLGKMCEDAKLSLKQIDGKGNMVERSIPIQHRDLFLSHAVAINRKRITRLGTGQDKYATISNDLRYLLTRSFAQAYGRNAGEIMLKDIELHRSKIKMAQIVIHLPDDESLVLQKQHLRRLENSVNEALTNLIGLKEKLPVFVNSYRIPMQKNEDPLITIRLMTHAQDVFDLLTEDTPEFFERILSGVAIHEKYKENKRGRTKILENRIWQNEIKVLHSKALMGMPFFRKWGTILEILKRRVYADMGRKRRNGWGHGLKSNNGGEEVE
jgi:hypothetical protein